jgi:MFS family permease
MSRSNGNEDDDSKPLREDDENIDDKFYGVNYQVAIG